MSKGNKHQAAKDRLEGRHEQGSHPTTLLIRTTGSVLHPMLRVTSCSLSPLLSARLRSAHQEVDCREPGSTTLPNLAIQSSGNLAVHLVGGAFRTAAATLVEQVDCSKSVHRLHGWIGPSAGSEPYRPYSWHTRLSTHSGLLNETKSSSGHPTQITCSPLIVKKHSWGCCAADARACRRIRSTRSEDRHVPPPSN